MTQLRTTVGPPQQRPPVARAVATAREKVVEVLDDMMLLVLIVLGVPAAILVLGAPIALVVWLVRTFLPGG